jgi:GntR family transcriptional regulator / MocR family aminotransferase
VSSWNLAVALGPRNDVPLYLQLARAIAADIQRGRLRPGAALPGSRALARQLAIHRNTVTAAYREVIAQGWTTSIPSRGIFVSQSLPHPANDLPQTGGRQARGGPPVGGLAPDARPPALTFNDGTPDARLAPLVMLAQAHRRALLQQRRSGWGYADPRGVERLRAAVAEMLTRRRAVLADEEGVLLTRGSQMALYLVAHALIEKGGTVAVEALGYRPAWEAFQSARACLLGVPVDADGLDVDRLERLGRRRRIQAVYLTPQHQYPTTVTLASCRRLQLLRWAERNQTLIIEDDYDHEFQFEGPPMLPLASVSIGASIAYVGSFSKLLAPGIRLGFVSASRPLIARMARLRAFIDRQGDVALERSVAALMEDGELQRHVRKAAAQYRRRRDRLVHLLQQTLAGELTFAVPPGGLSLWVNTPSDVDTEAWAERARKRGLLFAPGKVYSLDGQCPRGLRLGYAALDVQELRRAVDLLADTMRR